MSSKQLFDLLPSQLKNFFKKYPPSIQYAAESTSTHAINANPFLPNKHPVTGCYHEPKYSLRRMSDLYKLASLYGVQVLLPPKNKMFFEEKYANKKMMKGVLLPKGHKHELMHDEKMAKMAEAIKNADKYIMEVKGSKYKRRLERKKEAERTTWF
ncbi:MRPL25 (YGR076C) [Zygosaccharomyces parabailii]|nr:MRPL25 (YGR076C) [Zygosaccharomyces parabailii]CDH12649.1 probable 54S ribosomal protein L25,mitochondrial [Zygosaccharomyces bailii ISA1307]